MMANLECHEDITITDASKDDALDNGEVQQETRPQQKKRRAEDVFDDSCSDPPRAVAAICTSLVQPLANLNEEQEHLLSKEWLHREHKKLTKQRDYRVVLGGPNEGNIVPDGMNSLSAEAACNYGRIVCDADGRPRAFRLHDEASNLSSENGTPPPRRAPMVHVPATPPNDLPERPCSPNNVETRGVVFGTPTRS